VPHGQAWIVRRRATPGARHRGVRRQPRVPSREASHANGARGVARSGVWAWPISNR